MDVNNGKGSGSLDTNDDTINTDSAAASEAQVKKLGPATLLRMGPWALDKAQTVQHFGMRTPNNPGLLDELVHFSTVQPHFPTAYLLLLRARKARQEGVVKHGSVSREVEWSITDVRGAMSLPSGELTQGSGVMKRKTLAEAAGTESTHHTAVSITPQQANPTDLAKARQGWQIPPNTRHQNSSAPPPSKRKPGRPSLAKDPPFALQLTPVAKVSDIKSEERQKAATAIVDRFSIETRKAVKAGSFTLPHGKTVDAYSLETALAVEFAVYTSHWGTFEKPGEEYIQKYHSILEAVKENSALRDQLLNRTTSPEELATMSREKMLRFGIVTFHGPDGNDSEMTAIGQEHSGAIAYGSEDVNQESDEERANEVADIQKWDDIMQNYHYPEPEDVTVDYLNTCLLLPVDAPIGWPHLINLHTFSDEATAGLNVADMVVTVLYHHSVKSLRSFMDMKHDFTYRVRQKRNSNNHDFLVIREGTIVTCGMHFRGRWQEKHVYQLRGTAMARWTPLEYQGFGQVRERESLTVMVEGETFAGSMLADEKWEVPPEGRIEVSNEARIV